MERRWKIALGVAGALVAVAANGEPLASRKVSYADLNLNRDADVDRLRYRVRAAASRLCYDATRDSIAFENLNRLCFSDTVEGADRQIAQAVQAHRSNVKTALAAGFILVQTK